MNTCIQSRENRWECFVIVTKSKQFFNGTTFQFLANMEQHVHGVNDALDFQNVKICAEILK